MNKCKFLAPTPNTCGLNEVQADCKQECPPQDCDFDLELADCRPVPCQPGCNCLDGYLRNSSGICIPKNQCPPSKYLST